MKQPLPIDALQADLVAACGRVRRLVLRAPTGSGKSTTLAAMINYANANSRCHIITVEDPVEYELAGTTQVQVDVKADRTFANALRSILRLQRFMALARSRPALGLAESAAHCGFSDQAHLTRECRRISSLTPAALLRTQAPDWHGSDTVVALAEGDAVA